MVKGRRGTALVSNRISRKTQAQCKHAVLHSTGLKGIIILIYFLLGFFNLLWGLFLVGGEGERTPSGSPAQCCKGRVGAVLYLRRSVFANKVSKFITGAYLTWPVQQGKKCYFGGVEIWEILTCVEVHINLVP